MKPLTIVQFKPGCWIDKFCTNERFLFLGEIPNMPEHCAVIDHAGVIHWAYHTDNFEPVPDEEL